MTKLTQPWYWRSLPLENRTGSEIFATLFLNQGTISTLLESPYPSPPNQPQARYSICGGTPRIVNGIPLLWTPPIGKILPFLRYLSSSPPPPLPHSPTPPLPHSPTPPLPFTGGWLGWLGYDLAWEIEKLPQINTDPLPFPVAYWYEPECFAVLDHWDQTLWLAASKQSQLDHLQNQLNNSLPPSPQRAVTSYQLPVTSDHLPVNHVSPPPLKTQNSKLKTQNSSPTPLLIAPQADYEKMVRKAKKYIKAGDIFQANLSLRFEAQTTADSWSIYRALQQINPSPFASYWQTPWGSLISCSPERLVSLQGRTCQTRPIAGTRSRGATIEQDTLLAEELLTNTKERAEHIMLVDLERNDLGRVCNWGSVEVDELLAIERYSHVMHLVSNVKGILKQECDRVDLIAALFPGGTITGCPKVRCMEIIEELEPIRRNLFYGSCGYLDWNGNLDLNILIRTLLFSPSPTPPLPHSLTPPLHTVWGQVGAGIVQDSDPEKEWYESLHKAQAQLAALDLAIRIK